VTLARVLVTALIVAGALWSRPSIASAQGCDQLRFFTLHTAEKTAWDNHQYATLLKWNVEEANYADKCGHEESGDQRHRDLVLAMTHYADAGSVEVAHGNFALATKHFKRSNAIIAELVKTSTGDELENIQHRKSFNDDELRRAAHHITNASG
jgi:hypothetical protein